MNEVEMSIDPQFWHACAGRMIQMPLPNSYVYYFPQGHVEHTHTDVNIHQIHGISPCILCKVIDVKFLAHLELEEVYAKIRLIPLTHHERNLADTPTVTDKLSYLAKTLTRTDITSYLTVPRDKAQMVFPELSGLPNSSSQTIIAKDIRGESWKFKHISRGSNGRHVLSIGWKDFVKKKNLVVGNSVVFTQAENGELRVGIIHDKVKDINSSGRGRVRPEDVIKAASLAVNDEEFEITYYPRASSPEFIVKASSVNAAEHVQWQTGMRVMMSYESEDLSKESWFKGTVSAVEDADPLWPKSPWRRLLVNWVDDKKDLLQHEKRVSPWLVKEVLINLNIKNEELITHKFGQPQQVNHPSHDNAKDIDGMISTDLCKVFLEADDYCYGTLNLDSIGSYEEVKRTLQDWFNIKKFDDSTIVIYNDSAGVMKRMREEEPYSEFERAKKLTVIGTSVTLMNE